MDTYTLMATANSLGPNKTSCKLGLANQLQKLLRFFQVSRRSILCLPSYPLIQFIRVASLTMKNQNVQNFHTWLLVSYFILPFFWGQIKAQNSGGHVFLFFKSFSRVANKNDWDVMTKNYWYENNTFLLQNILLLRH